MYDCLIGFYFNYMRCNEATKDGIQIHSAGKGSYMPPPTSRTGQMASNWRADASVVPDGEPLTYETTCAYANVLLYGTDVQDVIRPASGVFPGPPYIEDLHLRYVPNYDALPAAYLNRVCHKGPWRLPAVILIIAIGLLLPARTPRNHL